MIRPCLYHMTITDPDAEPIDWSDPPNTAHAATLDFYRRVVTFPWKRITFADIMRIAKVIPTKEHHERS